MDPSLFLPNCPGRLVKTVEDALAFVPHPLPPVLAADWETAAKASSADNALGRLEGAARNLKNPYLLIGPLQRREAIVSSRIEGTITTAKQLVLYEAANLATASSSETREVHNYVRALEYGLEQLPTLPVCLRMIKDMHGILLTGVRGSDNRPGEFRDQQNAIGVHGQKISEARFVPPPPGDELKAALDAFEKFLHADSPLPLLVRLALIHYQFETIHPFVDGNGRVGRILIALLLCAHDRLSQPLLYMSAYFERNRDAYVDHMLHVSQRGEWMPWIHFFLQGVAEQCDDAVSRAKKLAELRDEYKRKLQRASGNVLALIDELCARPAISISRASELLGVTFRAASLIVEKLEKADILEEVTGRTRDRVYVASEIVKVIET
jgi:Fic family protein